MGILSFFKPSAHAECVSHYKRIRDVRLRLNNRLAESLPIDVTKEGAQRLGLLKGDVFVFGSEEEIAILMDYCIYDVRRQDRNAVERLLCECPPDIDSWEMECLRVMQNATYALVQVQTVQPRVGCQIENLLTGESRLLVDMGISASAKPGLVFATRLLDFGDYVATGGAAIPVTILKDHQAAEWRDRIGMGRQEDSFDPADLIRSCLRAGASEHIAYHDGDAGDVRRSVRRDKIPGRTKESAQSQRLLANQLHSSEKLTRRCKCRSGKMFKNCCGKT